jgi:hypothetical protein
MVVTDEATRAEALKILDGVEEMAKAEMIAARAYVTLVWDRERAEAGAICGGRKACAVGSLWLAAGVKVRMDERLPGVEAGQPRRSFLRRRPALRLAYEALNTAAERRAHRLEEGERVEFAFDAPRYGAAEALLERTSYLDDPDGELDKRKYISLVRSARRIVEAA